MEPPSRLGVGRGFAYLRSAMALAPMPEGGPKFGEVPPGVKVLGGTYALDGERLAFAHMDAVPGATPEIEAVLRSVGA